MKKFNPKFKKSGYDDYDDIVAFVYPKYFFVSTKVSFLSYQTEIFKLVHVYVAIYLLLFLYLFLFYLGYKVDTILIQSIVRVN